MRTLKAIHWPLVYLIVACGVLLYTRVLVVANFRYVFLIWNLILAYIPYAVANRIRAENSKIKILKNVVCLGTWLLFFPNAPYLVTDFVHLHHSSSHVIWYDVALLFMFAFTGMYLAIKSAFKIHDWLNSFMNKTLAFISMQAFFLLSGFGVYLGRVERWNSWNIVNDPFSLFAEISNLLTKTHVWEYSVVHFILISTIYMLFRFERQQKVSLCNSRR